MIDITPETPVKAGIKPADFRSGIDGLSRLCRSILSSNPRDGGVYVFRNRSAQSIKLLTYDGRGFWLCQYRLSSGKFSRWPTSSSDSATATLLAQELRTLLWGPHGKATHARPLHWQRVPLESLPIGAH